MQFCMQKQIAMTKAEVQASLFAAGIAALLMTFWCVFGCKRKKEGKPARATTYVVDDRIIPLFIHRLINSNCGLRH